jgi:hypothetical protein
MRRLNATLALLLFTSLGVFGVASEAGATTVLKLDKQSLVANSQHIVQGEVIDREAKVGADGRVYTHVTVEVEDSLKGTAPDAIEIKQLGGSTDELVTRSFGLPNFDVRENVILFLNKVRNRGLFTVTGLKQGKFTVKADPYGSKRFVVPNVGNLSLVERTNPTQLRNLAKTTPSDLHRAVWSLSSFKSEILNIVERQRGGPLQ